MQHQRYALSPLPDVGRAPSAPPHLPCRPSPLPQAPEVLIIGLFALRLTKRLIESLDYYPGRDADIIWLVNFLAPYHNNYELAKISGSRRGDYLAMYQSIVSRMKKQSKYPMQFMQMNPNQSIQQARRRSEVGQSRDMTDAERIDIIDFCDAAGEWGSILPIPANEAKRMVELADGRRIADLDETHRQPPRFDSREELHDRRQSRYTEQEGSHDQRHARFGNMEELQDRRQPRFEPTSLPHDMGRPLQEFRQPEREDRYRLHNNGARRGNEYLIPEERQTPEDMRRRRHVSFVDERPSFEDRRR
ncbi:hypothetical protein G6011_03608 [Alternaria panax]|uniref:Uncharacterized protein n=1 Tax=Alternaria panax TaxID=48097 RepID=A0AAD4IFM8_9PLEO|nr:hypothetical protein G6011_03608 [Alternaria panax]